MDLQKIGDFIMKLRKKNKLTQSGLASLVFVARETVGKWERGINPPDAHSLVLLAELFNVSVNEILAGEYINDSNKEKIHTLALNIISNNTKNQKKKRRHLAIIVAIIIMAFLFTYFIYNFNSMRVYIVTGENEEYCLSRSLIVISKQKSYIQIGSIINKEKKKNIASEKDYKVSVYYEDNNEDKLIFSSMGSEPLYTNLNNQEEDNYKELLPMLEHLYLVIEDESETSKIKLNTRLDYVNNHLFSFKIPEEKIENSDVPTTKIDETTNIKARSNKDWIVIDPVEYETESKKLSLSANCLESENSCRVIFTTTWKKPPKSQSYDIVGVRLSDTIFLDDNFSSIANDDVNPVYNYNSFRGFASIYKISNLDITSITQTFNVEYRGSVYASYQHASKKVKLEDVQNFNFSSTGYGEVFSWESNKTQISFDDMPGIKLILKEEK